LRLEGACFGVMSWVGRIGSRSYPWKVRETRGYCDDKRDLILESKWDKKHFQAQILAYDRK
jgi:hypothetical protein